MKKIEWDESVKIGVEIIDNQHKILFDLANDLNIAVSKGATKQVADILFSVIMNYAFIHFETEERFVQDENNYMQHCFQHYQLIRELQKFAVEFRNNRTGRQDPGEFLEEWLFGHIKEYDLPTLSKKKQEDIFPLGIDDFEDFDQRELDKRKHKRVRYEKLIDEDIIGHVYNANTLKNGTAEVVDLSGGGLKIYTNLKIEIDDLLVISCRVGKSFHLKEKVRVKTSHDNFYGVEFISPDKETVRFLTELCGAVHRYA